MTEQQAQQIVAGTHKRCSRCRQTLPLDNFHHLTKKNGDNDRQSHCKECSATEYQRRRSDPRVMLRSAALYRAKRRGVAFSITISDIHLPTECHYLNVLLDYTSLGKEKSVREDRAPVLSPINPDLGYIAGNVEVISALAHRLKSTATREQLMLFAEEILMTLQGECVVESKSSDNSNGKVTT